MLAAVQRASEEVFEDVVRLRRQIHQHPELAFEEVETARLVAETLRPLGLEIREGVAQTGVVAEIRGPEPGPTRLLRADMDALPIHEQNTFDFASRHAGKMHACGHDAHTASLLGTAIILHRLQDRLRGTVRLLFQPSEEKIPGGAKVMIEDGALKVEGDGAAIFGQHVQPDLPTGKIGVRGGMYMASADEIYLTIRGEGGHAAGPHRLQTDAVVAAAHVLVALQTVISRNCPPDVPSVLSFGKVTAEGATNVIPEAAKMEGTFRAMDEAWRFRAHDLIRRVATHTAEALGATCEVEIAVGYPALDNDEAATAHVRQAAEAYVGPENVVELERWFASEDFAWYLREMPGSFYRIGTGSAEADSTYGLHTPRFTIDEDALRTAPGFMAYLALTYTG